MFQLGIVKGKPRAVNMRLPRNALADVVQGTIMTENPSLVFRKTGLHIYSAPAGSDFWF